MDKTLKKWISDLSVWLGFRPRGSSFSPVIFLMCISFSTILWFLNALSKSYITTISHPVEYVNLPRNRYFVNTPPKKINLTVNAHGFTLLRYKLFMSFNPLNLDIEDLVRESPETLKGLYIVPAGNIRETVTSQMSNDIRLMEISPGAFTLAFDTLGSRRVPVSPVVVFDFKPRFGLASDIRLNPPTVTVSGSRNMIVNIDSIRTVPKTFKNLDATISAELELQVPPQVIVEPRKVILTAPVDEFTEKHMALPVLIDNQPENVKVRLFPNEVDVKFSVGLSSFSHIKTEEFELFVSWEDIEKKAIVLKVKIRKQPGNIKSVTIIPENVEYLIEKI
jgi:YbbR domain-containing protein